jgi:two-component system, NarL family, sensor histidine kinase DesK
MTVREAVTNVQRHAHAVCARVCMSVQRGQLTLCIEDDGRGGAIEPGNGLCGMRERLSTIGAELRVESERGRGTKVIASMPLPAVELIAPAAAALREA